MPLNKAAWDAFAVSCGERLRELEAQRAEFQALIDAGTGQALAVIQENVSPHVAAITAQIETLQILIALAEDKIAAIIGGGVGADQVSETATRVFLTPEQRALIGPMAEALLTAVRGPVTATDGNIPLFDGSPYKVKDSGRSISTIGSLARSARTANTALAKADNGTLIDITSGTFTQTFAAAAGLGDGWHCHIRNSGSGDITLDPDGAETIDGLASFIMYPGECRLIMCTGAAFHSVVVNAFFKTFTASGNFVKPPGYGGFGGMAWGGGGGGGSGGGSRGGGGGGGSGLPFEIGHAVFGSAGTSTPVQIGSGGAGASSGAAGGSGGTTTLGSIISVFGGGGAGTGPTAGGGGGGIFSSGATNGVGGGPFGGVSGTPQSIYGGGYLGAASVLGGGGGGSTSSDATAGGLSVFGGGGGGGAGSSMFAGGASSIGGKGGSGKDATNGEDGYAPAGGGGATRAGAKGGDGARGELRIWGII
ncbi:MAG TPA: hypothetical protein VNZ94_01725 [Xanthobacteraceae bacterium]|nr:hypothetical protein [Xanthobacteraceae bacterium]